MKEDNNSKIHSRIHSKMTVKELLEYCPEVVKVFLARKMACPGCLMESFDTIEESARSYEIDLNEFMSEIIAVAVGKYRDGGERPT